LGGPLNIDGLSVHMRCEDMECAICQHEWRALFPSDAEQLECPGCGYMNNTPPEGEHDVA
jgi:hypothetical protein